MKYLNKDKSEAEILFQITRPYILEKYGMDIVDFEELHTTSRKRPLVYARKIMMVILMEVYNPEPHKYTQEEIAEVVGLDRTSLIYHCKMHLNDYSMLKGYREEYDNLRDTFLEQIK